MASMSSGMRSANDTGSPCRSRRARDATGGARRSSSSPVRSVNNAAAATMAKLAIA